MAQDEKAKKEILPLLENLNYSILPTSFFPSAASQGALAIECLENRDDEARRFIALIDECYERNVNLIISSEKLIAEIYKGSKLEDPFKRTVSRLEEMRSRDYLAKPHLP